MKPTQLSFSGFILPLWRRTELMSQAGDHVRLLVFCGFCLAIIYVMAIWAVTDWIFGDKSLAKFCLRIVLRRFQL
jgi:hypothetical protein